MDSKWKMDPLFSTIEILIMRPPTKMAPPPPPPRPCENNEMDMENGSIILHQKDNPPSENIEMETENGS